MLSFMNAKPIFNTLIYNPVLWLDSFTPNGFSNSSWPANNASVSLWGDKSQSAVNAVQATGANQPSFVQNGINNKPAMYFNGTSQYFTNGAGNLITGNDLTVIVVASVTNITAPARPVFYSTRGNADAGGWQFETGSAVVANSAEVTTTTNTLLHTPINSVTASSPSIFCYKRVSSGLANTVYINNVNQTLTLGSNISFVTNASSKLIGQGNSLNAIHYFTGYMGELLLFNYSVSLDNIAVITRNLSIKWGIPI